MHLLKKIKISKESDFNASGQIQDYHGVGDLKKLPKSENSKEMVAFERATLEHQNIYNWLQLDVLYIFLLFSDFAIFFKSSMPW